MTNSINNNDQQIYSSTYDLIFKNEKGFTGLGKNGAEPQVFSRNGEAISPDNVRWQQFKKNIDVAPGPQGFRFASVKNYIERMQGDKVDYKSPVSLTNAREKQFEKAEAAAARGDVEEAAYSTITAEGLAKSLGELPGYNAAELNERYEKRGQEIRERAFLNSVSNSVKEKKVDWDKVNDTLSKAKKPLKYGNDIKSQEELVNALCAKVDGCTGDEHSTDLPKLLNSLQGLVRVGVLKKDKFSNELYQSLSKLEEKIKRNEGHFTPAQFQKLEKEINGLRDSLKPIPVPKDKPTIATSY